MAIKVAIQYGIFGGPKRGRKFRKQLAAAGYQHVKHSADADIIIAHSAGCFWLPEAPSDQKFMLVDPPYWPEKTVRERARSRAKTSRQYKKFNYPTHYRIWRESVGLYYAVFDFGRTRRIIKHAPQYDLEAVIRGHHVLLVRNDDDDWLTPDFESLKLGHSKLTTAKLPGDHDDIWFNPEPYINLLSRLQTETVNL